MAINKCSVLAKSRELCLNGEWQFRQLNKGAWMAAQVPGCNFSDLLRNNQISDPFYRDEEENLQWIEKEDWEYRKTFDVSYELFKLSEVELVFEGLDTHCNVYLNDVLIHENRNMFVGYRIACKEWLCVGNNELRIVFRSPINEVMPEHLSKGFTYPAENDKSVERLSVYNRKAPYHFGWDWGPRFVTSGIWRNVSLVAVDQARIDNVYIKQDVLTDDNAELTVDVQLHALSPFEGELVIECANVEGIKQTVAITRNSPLSSSTSLTIEQPQKWWPNGLGDAFLYEFTVSLWVEGRQVSQEQLNIGLRTIEVINEPDEHGECFYVKVNGQPTFMKGANYIPSDSFLDRVDDDKYQQIFADAVSANMNMLRVWGGGIYENDEFYQQADKQGILIWQDFMFACSLYPAGDEFVDNVKQEIEYNVKRLRNHACIALWCGNNETEMGIEFWHWPKTFSYSDELYEILKQEYDLVFKDVLPNTLAKFDDERFYFSSSPIGFWENKADDNRGDNHYWGVWHGEEPFSEFKHRVPRFMSEYGFQSFPLMSSVKQYSREEDWHLDSSVMKTHQKHPRGNKLIKQYMDSEYREPKDFANFLYMSQVQQGLGMKVAFEAHRAAMPFCMGSLYWQFNDCWPVASWSGIDYYGRWKALHYQAKRSFEPIASFIDANDETLSVSMVSDQLTTCSLQLTEKLITLDGDLVWQQQQVLDVKPLSSEIVTTHQISTLLKDHDASEVTFVAELAVTDAPIENHDNADSLAERLYQAIHYFVPTKELPLTMPSYDVTTDYKNGQLRLELTADTLARQVFIDFNDDVIAQVSQNSAVTLGNFSDNFFDLLAGETKVISLAIDDLSEENLAKLQSGLTIMSIADTYQA